MVTPQLFWENINPGQALPDLMKTPSTQQLVKYAGASGDFYQIHYDKDFAISKGLPSVIVHGALKSAFLAQLLTDWIGFDGRLKKLSVQYRGMDVPDDTLTCRGKVTRKYQVGNEFLVDCEIWIENSQGQTTTPGTATVFIPSNGIKA
jgi:acyl dehydratase